MGLIVKGRWVVTLDERRRVIRDGAVAVEGDRIVDVGKQDAIRRKYTRGYELLGDEKKAVLPGLIDAHLHMTQMLARGLADDVDLITWIYKRVLPYEAVMTDRDVYISAMLCGLEAIKTGTTCFADPGGYRMENVARAVGELGIRGIIAWASMDIYDPARPVPEELRTSTEEAVKRNEELVRAFNGAFDGRLKAWCGLRVEPNVSAELITKINEVAKKYNVGIHMHNAVNKEQMEWVKRKTGKMTVEYLDSLGVLGPHWLLVHMGWVSDYEVELLRKHDVKVAHVPGATMKGAYGCIAFGKFPEMIEKGVTVCLGCDSSAANNSLDMFRAMYLVATAHKEVRYKPDLISPEQALEMATVNGAKALMWDQEISSIEPGKKADLILIDVKRPNWIPNHEFSLIPNLVYSGEGRDVDTVIIDGRIVMQDRKVVTVDEEEILEAAQRSSEGILDRLKSKFGIEIKPRWSFA